MPYLEAAAPSQLLKSPELRMQLMNNLAKIGYAVTPSFLGPQELNAIRLQLREAMASSAPSWQPISRETRNFWWINDNNEMSNVKGAFLQVNFFPWDVASQSLFDTFGDVLRVRNLLLGESENAFFSPEEGDPITVRIAAQFYPSNHGWMQEHRDPEGPHQTVLASLVLSSFGADYERGGLFSRPDGGEANFPETELSPGDLIWFVPSMNHGVERIQDSRISGFRGWSDTEHGRWMLLIASNGLSPSADYARAAPVAN